MEISRRSPLHVLNFSERASLWSSMCQFNGTDGRSSPLPVLKAGAILSACGGTFLLARKKITEQMGSSWVTLCWGFDLPGELPSEKTIIRDGG